LPALVSGPVLGAWLDRTHHRKLALTTNQLILAASMAALICTLGRAPLAWSLLIAAAAGATLPLTSAGFTSLVPTLVPPAVLPRANTSTPSRSTAPPSPGRRSRVRSRPPPRPRPRSG
jgi:MFS family permease